MQRILRCKCTLEGLWRIFNAPPRLPEITKTSLANKSEGHTLLQRHKVKVLALTSKQTSFLQA